MGGRQLLLLTIGHYLVKLFRILRPRWTTGSEHARVSLISALDRLSAVGVIRMKGESREAFADRLAGHYPSLEQITATQLQNTFSIESNREVTLNQENQHLQRAISQMSYGGNICLAGLTLFHFIGLARRPNGSFNVQCTNPKLHFKLPTKFKTA